MVGITRSKVIHFFKDFIDADRFPIDLKGRKTKVQWPGGPRYDAPTLLIEEEIRCQQTMENMSGGCISHQTGETLAVARLGCAEEIVIFLVFFVQFIVGFCMIHAESKNTPIMRTSSNHFPTGAETEDQRLGSLNS